MTALHSIAFVSTATHLMESDELEGLLVESRDRNLRTGTTGVLLYCDGNFMQYFEGTTEAVAITYDRIRASRRHTGIIELVNEPITHRRFPDWQMALARPVASELLVLSTACWQRQLDSANGPGSDTAGMMLLKSFWRDARG